MLGICYGMQLIAHIQGGQVIRTDRREYGRAEMRVLEPEGLFAGFSSGQITNTDPEMLEVPLADPNNLECLHYGDPQTGAPPGRQPYPASGDCPAAPKP